MANPIVRVNVTQTVAPTPSKLQKTGALLTQGGTTLGAGNTLLLTQPSDLTAHLAAPLALTSLTYSGAYGGQVTAVTAAAHGVPVNQQFVITIAGSVPAAYNGTYFALSTGSTGFTYYLSSNPGTSPATTAGTYTPPGVAELTAMVASFFGQGQGQSVYVLELGAGQPAAGVAVLQNFINNSPQEFYSYLTPRNWDANSDFLTFAGTLNSTTSKTYFFVTTNLQNWQDYPSNYKCVLPFVEAPFVGTWAAGVISDAQFSTGIVTLTTSAAHGIAPGQFFQATGIVPAGFNGTFMALPGTTGTSIVYALAANPGSYISGGALVQSLYPSNGVPATTFDWAAGQQITLNYDPAVTNRVTPFEYSFLSSATPFPLRGNQSLIGQLSAASVSYCKDGSEGGFTNLILVGGETADGRPFNYWYSVDWVQINAQRAIAAAVIDGSNNPINPLYYNQDGINRLATVVTGVGASAISFGLALGTVNQVSLDGPQFQAQLSAGKYAGNVVVNAVPFVNYTAENPGDYKEGLYKGLSMTYTPLRGFDQILININVTDFVSA